jgi:uncharacterized Zn finger protein
MAARLWDEETRRAGQEYAAAGQVARFEVRPGCVHAAVQGRAPRPYATTIAVPELAPAQWSRLVEHLAAEAQHAANLLAGNLPQGLAALFAGVGAELLPADPAAVALRCTCGAAGPCKHSAALARLMIDRLDADPLLIFTLRGLSGPELINRLRQARAMQTAGAMAAHSDPLLTDAARATPLEQSLEAFWRAPPALAEVSRQAPAEHAPHALLRRLGPSPLQGRFPLAGLLASVYDEVTRAAQRLRAEAEESRD